MERKEGKEEGKVMVEGKQEPVDGPTTITSDDKSSAERIAKDDPTADVGIEISDTKTTDILLWEEEIHIREQVAKSPITGNFLGAFFVNIYSAIYIVTVYLISFESIISITLSVSLTVCK